MKKSCLLAFAIAGVLVGCSEDELVSENVSNLTREIPIEFSVQKENVTRAANLETVKHYNFGVWAWKVSGKNSLADMEVMNHYLVGYSNGTDKGYNHEGATTWNANAGTVKDHVAPWFYEGLGTTQYKDADYGYKTTDTDYMSAKDNQYLRYWDLAYEYTNFYSYAPYNKNVTFEKKSDSSVMTFDNTKTIRDGYDEPQNHVYDHFDRSLSEYMYASNHENNASLSDVKVEFKHMGAQVFIRFYEDIENYKVEIIDLDADHGTLATGVSAGDGTKGIQLAPSVENSGSYSKGKYYTTQGATISFPESGAAATYTPSWTGSTQTETPLMFQIPSEGKSTATDAPANLTEYNGLNGTKHNIIAEKLTTGPDQKYSYSPTIYYAVAQPTTSETGFNFHISYHIIAEDNQEVITVHNATVFIPATEGSGENLKYLTVWQPNTKYTYTFKITKNSTGTTNPDTPIDPTDATPSGVKALYPIVFDNATIDEYEVVEKEKQNENTNY